MTEGTTFADFIRRIRAGDDRAAQELVERYEPVIRREVRLRGRGTLVLCRAPLCHLCTRFHRDSQPGKPAVRLSEGLAGFGNSSRKV